MPKEFKKPNLNAPRYRKTTFNPLNKEFFKLLKEAHPHLQKYSEPEIRKIIKVSNEFIAGKMVELRDGIEFPELLGNSLIGTCKKKKGDNPNYKLSAELSKKIQQRNWESDGYLAKILYTNHEIKYKFKFHTLWTFKACRALTKATSVAYIKDWKKYIHLDSTMHITKLYRKQKINEKDLELKSNLLIDYNEFAGFN